jgi:hypothetical protein
MLFCQVGALEIRVSNGIPGSRYFMPRPPKSYRTPAEIGIQKAQNSDYARREEQHVRLIERNP